MSRQHKTKGCQIHHTSTAQRPLVLASSSPYRSMLLARLGLSFEAVAPRVDETRRPAEAPDDLARRLAVAKASAVASDLADGLVIGSDQVAVLDGEILGKPGEFSVAEAQLLRSSGKKVEFCTAVCLLDAASGRCQIDVVRYEVQMRELTPALVGRYLERDQPFDCAGSFKSEGLGIALFSKMSGEDPTALTGLPLIRLVSMLAEEGVQVP